MNYPERSHEPTEARIREQPLSASLVINERATVREPR